MDLSYRAQLKGGRFVYLNDVETPAELPVDMDGFKDLSEAGSVGTGELNLALGGHIPLLDTLEQAPILAVRITVAGRQQHLIVGGKASDAGGDRGIEIGGAAVTCGRGNLEHGAGILGTY